MSKLQNNQSVSCPDCNLKFDNEDLLLEHIFYYKTEMELHD